MWSRIQDHPNIAAVASGMLEGVNGERAVLVQIDTTQVAMDVETARDLAAGIIAAARMAEDGPPDDIEGIALDADIEATRAATADNRVRLGIE